MIYLDNNATTPPGFDLKLLLEDYYSKWHNPSSAYAGEIRNEIENFRNDLADFFTVEPHQVVFTSGATEGNNQVIRSFTGLHMVSAIEHDSVFNILPASQVRIPVTTTGLDFAALKQAISLKCSLASFMLVNNESGHILPIEEIYNYCQASNIPLHVDATQALGKTAIPPYFDYLTISGHKVHALKGIGILICKAPVKPLLIGGHQESGLRAGTENTLGILSLKKVFDRGFFLPDHESHYDQLWKFAETQFKQQLPTAILLQMGRLPFHKATFSFCLPGVTSEEVVTHLMQHNIAVSSGSACTNGYTTHSRVILALTGQYELAQGVVRCSFSRFTTTDDIAELVTTLAKRYR